MEYFKYEYENVQKEFKFSNFENFLFHPYLYKFYLFDLSLLRFDPKTDDQMKLEAKSVINKQKALFILPYPIVALTLLFYKRKNLLDSRYTGKIVFSLFTFVVTTRIIQKGLIKHEGDKILIDIAKNKSHSI
jgi:hypothetical protein